MLSRFSPEADWSVERFAARAGVIQEQPSLPKINSGVEFAYENLAVFTKQNKNKHTQKEAKKNKKNKQKPKQNKKKQKQKKSGKPSPGKTQLMLSREKICGVFFFSELVCPSCIYTCLLLSSV